MYLFSSLGRGKHTEVSIWSNPSFNLSSTQRLGKRRGFHITYSSLWHGSVEVMSEGRQAVILVAWLEGDSEGFKAMRIGTEKKTERDSLFFFFFPESAQGQACTC